MRNVAEVQFTPLKDFHSPELQSGYVVGLSYAAQPEDRLLLSLLPKWIDAGLVKLGAPDAPLDSVKVFGLGKVE